MQIFIMTDLPVDKLHTQTWFTDKNAAAPVTGLGTRGHQGRSNEDVVGKQKFSGCLLFRLGFTSQIYFHNFLDQDQLFPSQCAIGLATGRSKSGAAANSTRDTTMHHWPLQLQKDAIIALHLSPDSVVVTSLQLSNDHQGAGSHCRVDFYQS